jgi:hypothetical protein
MTQRNFDIQKRVAQLDRLERQNRRTRVGLAVLAAGFFGAMSVGATSSPSIPNLLVAESFRLVDEQGALRGLLETDAQGRVVLSAISGSGEKATRFVLSDTEPYLEVHDPTGAEILNVGAPVLTPVPSQVPSSRVPKAAVQDENNGGGGAEEDDSFDWVD